MSGYVKLHSMTLVSVCLVCIISGGGLGWLIVAHKTDCNVNDPYDNWSPSAKQMAMRIETKENAEKIRSPFWKAFYLHLRDVRERENKCVTGLGVKLMLSGIGSQKMPELTHQEAILILRQISECGDTTSFGLLAPYISKAVEEKADLQRSVREAFGSHQ